MTELLKSTVAFELNRKIESSSWIFVTMYIFYFACFLATFANAKDSHGHVHEDCDTVPALDAKVSVNI